jgi:PKD repeat protein/peptidoglycan/xylan/chitin deacetylase (PgdA/CDA1 family)
MMLCFSQGFAEQLLNLPKPLVGLRYNSFAELDKKWPVTHGEGSVCLWGDDKHSAVSFTIDDNIPGDIPFWQQASADYGWKFTWFIIVHPYMWDIYSNTVGSSTGFGTAAQYKVLYDQGHEIELHGATGSMNSLSTNDYREHLILAKNYLESIVSNNITTFAYPSGELDSGDGSKGYRGVAQTLFVATRGGTGGSAPPATVDYLNTQSMGTALFTGAGSRWEALEDKTNKVIASSAYRGWAVVLNHKVQDKPGTLALFDYLKANEFKYWIKPFSHVGRYAQERESSTLTITQVVSNQISFTLTDRMDDSLFNVPLTVKFCVNGWGGTSAVQNGQPVAARLITYSNVTYALVDAVPDQGPVTVSGFDAAGFTAEPTSGLGPLTVSFVDTSTFSGITNRFWDFGDGTTTNTAEITVSHTYETAGTNTVQLIISSPAGVNTNIQVGLIRVTVPIAPSAGFNIFPSSGSLPLTVSFTDISNGTITNRFWDFGDGFTTNTTSTTIDYTYLSTGTNTVQLIVSGPAGASTNIQVDAVTVAPLAAPVAGFSLSPASGAAPLAVTFTDTSTGSVTNRLWDFGDGFTTNTAATNVLHTYTSDGSYTVGLTVSGEGGISTNIQADCVTVTVPVASFAVFTVSTNIGTAPLGVSFTDTSTGTITNRFWSFGDGATTNTLSTSVAHTYTVARTSTVQLIVSGPAGASTNSQTILINAAPAPTGGVVRLDISSAFNYDAVATDAERLYGISQSNQQVGVVLGDHAISSTTTKYSFSYNPNGASKGLPTDGLVAGGKYEFAKGLVGAAKYGTVDGTTKVNNTVTTKGFNNAWVTITLPIDQQQKYSDFNVLMSSRRYTQTGKTVTLTAGLEYKYAGDATWYSVINESVSSSTDKGGAFGGRFDNAGSTTPATDGVWSSVAMPATGTASGSGPTSFGTTQGYAFELATPVALDNTKTLEAIRIKTGTSNASYINEGFLYAVTATQAASPEPGGTDDDNDGIPNDWETRHFGGNTNAHPNAMAANGVNTLIETYIAGLDPTNPASVFTVSNSWNSLRWNAASGRVYSVYRSTNLLNGFQPLETNIVWPQNSWTGQVNGLQADFYKVKVELFN